MYGNAAVEAGDGGSSSVPVVCADVVEESVCCNTPDLVEVGGEAEDCSLKVAETLNTLLAWISNLAT